MLLCILNIVNDQIRIVGGLDLVSRPSVESHATTHLSHILTQQSF